MKSSPLMSRLLRGWLTLAVPVLLLVGSIRLVMTPFWLTTEYTRPGFPADGYGFSTENRLEYGIYGIEYLLNGEPIAFLGDLRLPIDLCFNAPLNAAGCQMFNPSELQHMHDVKQVTIIAFSAALVTGILALIAGVSLWRTSPRLVLIALLQGSLLTVGLIITIVVIAVTSWNFFFDTFHALFFQSGTWRFYYSDTLIRLYPEQFWFDAALTTGILTTLGALLVGGWAWWRLKPKDL